MTKFILSAILNKQALACGLLLSLVLLGCAPEKSLNTCDTVLITVDGEICAPNE